MLWAQTQTLPDLIHVLVYVVPVDERRSRRGGKQARQEGHSGRLAGPVVTQERGDLALVQVQGKVVNSWR